MLNCNTSNLDCTPSSLSCSLPSFKMDCGEDTFDLSLNDECGFDTDCQIESALILALFIKARDPSQDNPCLRGGWWADNSLGSRLWTLESGTVAGNSEELITKAEQYLEESLDPLISLGIIKDISVNASYADGVISFDNILIERPGGQTNDYSYLWEESCGRR